MSHIRGGPETESASVILGCLLEGKGLAQETQCSWTHLPSSGCHEALTHLHPERPRLGSAFSVPFPFLNASNASFLAQKLFNLLGMRHAGLGGGRKGGQMLSTGWCRELKALRLTVDKPLESGAQQALSISWWMNRYCRWKKRTQKTVWLWKDTTNCSHSCQLYNIYD